MDFLVYFFLYFSIDFPPTTTTTTTTTNITNIKPPVAGDRELGCIRRPGPARLGWRGSARLVGARLGGARRGQPRLGAARVSSADAARGDSAHLGSA